jgi:hypothetical protein
MIKTIVVDGFKVTIQFFEDQESQAAFIEELKNHGYELGEDERIKPNTYHLCLDGLGVMYNDELGQ